MVAAVAAASLPAFVEFGIPITECSIYQNTEAVNANQGGEN
ncbi:hypothetical protein GJA_1652 [Janthinobacterium agaricidamnosum NBRC 102515 = DSM 9628]|uniref:Uncharacterized protein n=1 Tax=Janthinobacterium agaricidamnosum NBRC 102515 = DSM 9628 TaxID=1349767 RepID=W0V3U7_9BURK|nr:hypothetical protein GJA_1652 [Janthinobacterium agaricidamnosum NBRC 102515 = DSM 9628]